MESASGRGRRGLGWSCGLVRRGGLLDMRSNAGYRGGWDSVDVDGDVDGPAADGFADGQQANCPISSRTLGLVKGIVGQHEYLVVRHETRLDLLPRKNRPADRTGDVQIRFGALYPIRPGSD